MSYTAWYLMWINPVAGVVVANNVRAPLDPMVDPKGKEPQTNPPLRRLSDYTFLCLQNACKDDKECLGRIEWVIHQDVDNKVAQRVVKQIMSKKKPTSWPGKTFSTDDDEGKALVGCPNGYGLAYMLAQHQSALGKKTIDSVVVFKDKYGEMSLAFHVRDMTEDEQS